MEHYLIIIEKGQNNYSAYSPDVVGCVATGKTLEKTIQEMKNALRFHLEGLRDQGIALPHAKGLSQHLQEIDANAGDLFAFVDVELEAIAA